MAYPDATPELIEETMERSWKAFHEYRKQPIHKRVELMHAIADEILALGDDLIHTASRETNLPFDRLAGERNRTIFQLKSYSEGISSGRSLEIRIDKGDASAAPPKPDLRKMKVPLGPVVIFGASNFPFAYSTAGGDTASALAAGCTVVVKAHPAHPETSEKVTLAIKNALKKAGLPESIFEHLHGKSFEVGKALVLHRYTCAVAFTGSFTGGRALFDLNAQRRVPIPVFCEMGSVNPVFILPQKLKESTEDTARNLAASVTLSVGQFCTNPGIIFGIEGETLDNFIKILGAEARKKGAAPMLHEGIAKGYKERSERAVSQPGVDPVDTLEKKEGTPLIASVSGKDFLDNPILHEEVFGPFSIVVRCANLGEMTRAAESMEGQLTTTIIATEEELLNAPGLVDVLSFRCGRIIFNGVPTGVEVSHAMTHGGPYPATTDSRFSAVGEDAIQRFLRPLSFQNWPASALPSELQNDNPVHLERVEVKR